jgi:hypothetical protein
MLHAHKYLIREISLWGNGAETQEVGNLAGAWGFGAQVEVGVIVRQLGPQREEGVKEQMQMSFFFPSSTGV